MHIARSPHRRSALFGASLMLLVALFAGTRAFAGPPLLCHPINIGSAKSLPGGNGPHGTDRSYERKNLIKETLALLTPSTPILVRMETLRRATVYASNFLSGTGSGKSLSADDKKLAFDLLAQLKSRAHDNEKNSSSLALALFDLGYLSECYKQASLGEGLTGYDLMKRALEIRGNDAALHFACAMVSIWPRRPEYEMHVSKAKAGVEKGSLLASNIDEHFSH